MLLFLPHAALLLLHFGIKDAICRKTNFTVIKVRLGEQVSLDCMYNCSSGFIRGIWKWEHALECSDCLWTITEKNTSEDMCTVSLQTVNLTLKHTMYNYSCFSVKNDHEDLPHKLERLVSLQIQDRTTGPVIPHEVPLDVTMKVAIYQNEKELIRDKIDKSVSSYSIQVPVGDKLKLECSSTNQHCEGQWMKDGGNITGMMSDTLLEWHDITEEDEGTYTCHTKQLCNNEKIKVVVDVIKNDDFGWVRPFAATALSAAVILLCLLIYLCYQKKGKILLDGEDSTVIYENTRPKNEGMIHKPTEQDCQSDHEVPYADIVISVRGSSIPELTGLHGQTPRDHRLRWRDESHLQACRSADRLHVHPREVSRKLSTTSEYAIITYSTDVLY